jgi:hypothetical protein
MAQRVQAEMVVVYDGPFLILYCGDNMLESMAIGKIYLPAFKMVMLPCMLQINS